MMASLNFFLFFSDGFPNRYTASNVWNLPVMAAAKQVDFHSLAQFEKQPTAPAQRSLLHLVHILSISSHSQWFAENNDLFHYHLRPNEQCRFDSGGAAFGDHVQEWGVLQPGLRLPPSRKI